VTVAIAGLIRQIESLGDDAIERRTGSADAGLSAYVAVVARATATLEA
jgi:hypothetical protein